MQTQARRLHGDSQALAMQIGILQQRIPCDMATCQTAAFLSNIGALAVLQLIQVWYDARPTKGCTAKVCKLKPQPMGRRSHDSCVVACAASCQEMLIEYHARVYERLAQEWRLPPKIQALMQAVHQLPAGAVKPDLLVMRMAYLMLHAPDSRELQELNRLVEEQSSGAAFADLGT